MRERIGVVGAGRMGLPIATRLSEAGHAVTVVDRDAGRLSLAAARGLETSSAAADVAAASDLVVTVLPGASEFHDVMHGAVLPTLRPGSLWVDLTSNDPRVADEAAQASIGVGAVGAPMAGGPDAARDAALGFFVAGAADAVARARPILDVLAAPGGIRVVGDEIGMAYSAKLLVNALWFGQVAAVTETLLLGQRLGLPAGAMVDVLGGSAADSAFVQRHLPLLLAGDDMADFPIRGCLEELDILAELAASHAAPWSASESVTDLYRAAVARFGDADGELLVARLLEERAGTRLG